MFGKKAARLATAVLLVGVAMGARQVSGATVHHVAHAAPTGIISMTDWQFPDGCNLVAAASAADAELCSGQMEDSLFLIDQNLNYQPDLNVDIPSVKNGDVKTVNGNLVVTYKLKPNLKWSDGSPLTVDDVIFSVKVLLAVGATTGIDQITDMHKIDSRTVQFTYKGIYAPYVAYGNPSPLLPMAYLEKKYGTSDIQTIANKYNNDTYHSPSDVFSGAFKIASWTNGQSVTLVPNPYYNALPPDPHHPLPAQIKFVNISGDESTLATDLQSSNAGVDQAEDFQATDLPVLYASKYHIHNGPALFVEHLELNQAGPLHDVRLRQALQYAIDKPTLYHLLFPQVTNVKDFMLNSVLPNTSPWDDKSIPLSEYNVAKAKALMTAAGYSTDYNLNAPGKHLILNFATTSAAVRQKDFQILARYWATIGVHVVPHFTTAYGNNGLFEIWANNGVLIHRRFDIALFAYTELPDPQQSEGNFNPALVPNAADGHHTGADQNYVGEVNPVQWNLLQQARHTTDVNQRHAIINQWQRVINADVPWIMLYARSNIAANDGTIGNYLPNPSQATNEWNAFEWYKVGAS